MTFDLYYLDFSPPCRAVHAVAQCLGVTPNLKPVNLRNGEHKTPEYLKLNPAHTVPTMVDDGFALFESRAIMKYLINKYKPDSHLYPNDAKKRAVIDQYLDFECGTISSAMRWLMYPKFFKKQDPSQEAIDNFNEKLAIFEAFLADKKFLTGDEVTLADISVVAALPNLKLLGKDMLTAKVHQYIDRVHTACPHLKKLNEIVDKPLPSA